MQFWFRETKKQKPLSVDETFFVSANDGLVGFEMVHGTAHIWVKMRIEQAVTLADRITKAASAAKLMEASAEPASGTRNLDDTDTEDDDDQNTVVQLITK